MYTQVTLTKLNQGCGLGLPGSTYFLRGARVGGGGQMTGAEKSVGGQTNDLTKIHLLISFYKESKSNKIFLVYKNSIIMFLC